MNIQLIKWRLEPSSNYCKAMVDKRKSNREQKEIKPNPKIHPKLMATTGLLTGNGYVGKKIYQRP